MQKQSVYSIAVQTKRYRNSGATVERVKYLFSPTLAVFLLAGLIGCTKAPVINEDTHTLPPCGSFPNCVNSESSEAIEPISASELQWQQLIAWISERDDWELIYHHQEIVHAVAKTPLLKFRDDVVLKFDPARQLIQIRSSSRLGIGDLGANRDRLEFIRNLVSSNFIPSD